MRIRRYSSFCALLTAFALGCNGSSSGNNQTATDAATGTPQASISPTSLSVATLACSATKAAQGETLTLSNAGTETLEWSAKLDNVVAFSINPSSGSVAPGKSQPITITPNLLPTNATAGETYAGTVTITSNDPQHPSVSVPVAALAQGAAISVSPASLDFGLTSIGQTSPAQTLQITNSGNAPATLALTSSDPSFTISPASLTVAGGASGTAAVSYKPKAASSSPENAQITLSSTSTLCSSLPSAISAIGEGTAGAVTFSPGTIDFGNVPCQSAAAAPSTFTVANTGNAPFSFTVALGMGDSSPYTVTPQGAVVGGGQSTVVTVSPKALPFPAVTTANGYGDTVTLTTTAAGDMPHTITLTETAEGAVLAFAAPAAGLSASAELQIGTTSTTTVTTGTTTAGAWTVNNTGNMSTSIAFNEGPNSGSAVYVAATTAAAGMMTTIPITLQPTQLGPNQVALSPVVGATDAEGNILSLSGAEGIAPLCAPIAAAPSTNVTVGVDLTAFDNPVTVWTNQDDTLVLGKNFGYLMGDLSSEFDVAQEYAFPLPFATTSLVGSDNGSLCLLGSDQSVSCTWNRSIFQSLSPQFTTVSGLSGVTALAYDWEQDVYCALATGGAVVCFDDGSAGPVGGLPANGVTSFAIMPQNSQICWADPNATTANEVFCAGFNGLGSSVGGTPVDEGFATNGAVDAITGASQFACAVGSGGTSVGCWGSNTSNELGVTSGDTPPAVSVTSTTGAFPPAGSTVTQVAAGYQNACAIVKGSGGNATTSLWCWGDNDNGQLGQGTTGDSSLAVQVPGITPTSLSVGLEAVCAVSSLESGTQLYCWGYNDDYNTTGVGNPEECDQESPYPVPFLSTDIVEPGEQEDCD